MDDIPHGWQHNGRTLTFTWVGDIDVRVTRVYALAFTPDGKLLLVGGGPGDPGYWLPGGGIEDGETPENALIRELFEEAAARSHETEPERIGLQRVDDSTGGSEYHAFYWCRVMLADEFIPGHEVAERKMVEPKDFLDTLFWGREDPKATILLERGRALMRWVAIFDDNEAVEAIREQYSAAHIDYLAANRDVIRIAGGLRPAPDEWYCGGLWVLEVGSRAEAVALIEADPFFVHGLRRGYRLLVWGKAPCYGSVEL